MHNLGRKSFTGLKSVFNGNATVVHGNEGKVHVDEQKEKAYAIIHRRLQYLNDNFSMPFAMRIVTDEVGRTSTRDDDTEKVHLPPSFSKRQEWIRICYDCGWVVKFKCRCKSLIAQVSDWELREGFYKSEFMANENGGQVAKPIVSWRSFLRYWKKAFPKLQVRAKGEDTCTDCHVYKLRLQHLMKKKKFAEEAIAEGGDDDGTTPDELADIVAGMDKLIAEMRKHVDMHIAQREEYNRYQAIAKDDIENEVLTELLTKFLVIDMAQNGALPTLRGDQPGDFYYISPLTQLIFGVCSPAEQKMNTFIWEEGEADRGADNIISCLYWDLEKRGIIAGETWAENTVPLAPSTHVPIAHLVIGADNCGGQNKNKAMIMFCMWLHEAGWVTKVTLLFLVKGHTKNDGDKYFNLLKQGTAGEDLWTAEQLDAAYTKNNANYISLYRVPGRRWRGWTSGLKQLYRDPPSGSIKANHIFVFGDSSNSTTYKRMEYRDSPNVVEFDLRPTARSTKDIARMSDEDRQTTVCGLPWELDLLPPPGLSEIKANECQNKIRPLVPEEDKHYYERMTDELQEQYDKKQQAKNRNKTHNAKEKQRRIQEANKDKT